MPARPARYRFSVATALGFAALLVGVPPLNGAGRAGASVCSGRSGLRQGTISVPIVVEGSGGQTATCMEVAGGSTGIDLLYARASALGLPAPRFDPQTGLLCAIDGFPATGCGERTATGYAYWSYWIGDSGSWSYATIGPGSRRLAAGRIDGWRFVSGNGQATDQPPATPPVVSNICQPEPPPATQPQPTQPAATQPAATQPAATQPAATQPAATQPAATQPAATQPPATQGSTIQGSGDQTAAQETPTDAGSNQVATDGGVQPVGDVAVTQPWPEFGSPSGVSGSSGTTSGASGNGGASGVSGSSGSGLSGSRNSGASGRSGTSGASATTGAKGDKATGIRAGGTRASGTRATTPDTATDAEDSSGSLAGPLGLVATLAVVGALAWAAKRRSSQSEEPPAGESSGEPHAGEPQSGEPHSGEPATQDPT
jgi:hypothetical protein